MSKISERIGKALLHRKMSQSKLAEKVGLSKEAISMILSGITKSPTPENLFKIADALNYKARYLCTGEGWMTVEEETEDTILIGHLPKDERKILRAMIITLAGEPNGVRTTNQLKKFKVIDK